MAEPRREEERVARLDALAVDPDIHLAEEVPVRDPEVLHEVALQVGARLPREAVELLDLDHGPVRKPLGTEVLLEIVLQPLGQIGQDRGRDHDPPFGVRVPALADLVDVDGHLVPLAVRRPRVDGEALALAHRGARHTVPVPSEAGPAVLAVRPAPDHGKLDHRGVHPVAVVDHGQAVRLLVRIPLKAEDDVHLAGLGLDGVVDQFVHRRAGVPVSDVADPAHEGVGDDQGEFKAALDFLPGVLPLLLEIGAHDTHSRTLLRLALAAHHSISFLQPFRPRYEWGPWSWTIARGPFRRDGMRDATLRGTRRAPLDRGRRPSGGSW